MSANDENVDLQKQIINKINDVSQTRIALFEQLQSMYLSIHDSVSDRRGDVADQLKVVGIVETELKGARERAGLYKQANQNNLRKIEINTYYSKKYKAYYEILQIIVYTCIPLIVILFLGKYEIISDKFATVLGILIIIIPAVILLYKIVAITTKNNMDFDKLSFSFNPNDEGLPEPTEGKKDSDGKGNGFGFGGCFDSQCCGEGSQYDSEQHICIVPKFSEEKEKKSLIVGQSTQMPGDPIDK